MKTVCTTCYLLSKGKKQEYTFAFVLNYFKKLMRYTLKMSK